jgi:hypothetical protein
MRPDCGSIDSSLDSLPRWSLIRLASLLRLASRAAGVFSGGLMCAAFFQQGVERQRVARTDWPTPHLLDLFGAFHREWNLMIALPSASRFAVSRAAGFQAWP